MNKSLDGIQVLNTIFKCIFKNFGFELSNLSYRFLNILLNDVTKSDLAFQKAVYLIKVLHPGICCLQLKMLSLRVGINCLQHKFLTNSNQINSISNLDYSIVI